MNKRWLMAGLLVLGALSGSGAADRTGSLGLNYTVGPSFIVGGSGARDAGSLQPGVGAALQYSLTNNVDALFSYDYLHADLRTQAITFGGQYRLTTHKTATPFVGAGIGFGKPYSGEGWDHFSLKLMGGLEETLTDSVSLAGILGYQYVEGGDPIGSVHSIEPGIRLIYYFGRAAH